MIEETEDQKEKEDLLAIEDLIESINRLCGSKRLEEMTKIFKKDDLIPLPDEEVIPILFSKYLGMKDRSNKLNILKGDNIHWCIHDNGFFTVMDKKCFKTTCYKCFEVLDLSVLDLEKLKFSKCYFKISNKNVVYFRIDIMLTQCDKCVQE